MPWSRAVAGFERSISLAIVPTMREPVMPNGWPIEIEPPVR